MSTATLHNEKKKTLVPQLRFQEFDGEWEEKKLGDIGKIKMCKRVFSNETSEDGEIPFYKIGTFGKEADAYITNELFLNYKSRFSYPKIGDILMSASGTLGRTVVFDGKPSYFQDSNIVWIENNEKTTTNSFLYFIYQIVRYDSEGGTIQRLYNSIISNTKFYNPTLPEQQKIASFLSAVDDKIQQLTRKATLLEQYKKGVMQQLFSGKLRFKDENGKDYPDWEENKLGECLDYIQPTKYLVSNTEYDNSYKTPVLTAGKTFILGYTNETEGIFKNNLPVIIFDDFTTATQFVDFPFKAKSSAMKILAAKKEINIKFIYEAMQIMNYEIGGHERHWISKFAHIEIQVPSYSEQQKIADFLSSIDSKIEKVNQQLAQTQTFKKGLLQQMFV